MKIEVTDIETKTKQIYDLSRDNWARRWACMKNGLVHMWAPTKLAISHNCAIKTSGRIWRVINE